MFLFGAPAGITAAHFSKAKAVLASSEGAGPFFRLKMVRFDDGLRSFDEFQNQQSIKEATHAYQGGKCRIPFPVPHFSILPAR